MVFQLSQEINLACGEECIYLEQHEIENLPWREEYYHMKLFLIE
jgi:hypothetical protein